MTRYIFPILLVLLAVAMYVLEINPMYAQIQNQLAKEVELNDYIDKAHKANDKLNMLDERYAAFPANSINAINILLPDSIDHVKFIIEMNDLVAQYGLVMRGPKVALANDKNNKNSPYDKYSFSFSVTTTYPTFRALLRGMEENLALRDISSVTFSAVRESNDNSSRVNPETALYSYTVEIFSYALHK